MIVLGCTDLDYALRFDHPTDQINENIVVQKTAYNKWE